MVRFNYDPTDGLDLAVGHDHATRFFITVEGSYEAITRKIEPKFHRLCAGNGIEAHTGLCGLGQKLSPDEMKRLWKSLNVDQQHLSWFDQYSPEPVLGQR